MKNIILTLMMKTTTEQSKLSMEGIPILKMLLQ